MDDRTTWIWIGGALAVAVVVGAVGYLISRDSGSDAAPQASPPITIDGGSGDANHADPEGSADNRARRGPGTPREWDAPGHELIGVDRKVAVHSSPGGGTVRTLGPETEFGGSRVMWVVERRGPWLGVLAPELGNDRVGWVRNEPSRLRFGTTPYRIDVDLSDRLVELSRSGEVVRRVVVSVGRIGSNTPPGRFAVTDLITRGLDPAYGCCAIALSARQPNLPPGWIGGDRIAIHGWAGEVGESASGGCLRAENRDVRWMMDNIHLGTPVFVQA